MFLFIKKKEETVSLNTNQLYDQQVEIETLKREILNQQNNHDSRRDIRQDYHVPQQSAQQDYHHQQDKQNSNDNVPKAKIMTTREEDKLRQKTFGFI